MIRQTATECRDNHSLMFCRSPFCATTEKELVNRTQTESTWRQFCLNPREKLVSDRTLKRILCLVLTSVSLYISDLPNSRVRIEENFSVCELWQFFVVVFGQTLGCSRTQQTLDVRHFDAIDHFNDHSWMGSFFGFDSYSVPSILFPLFLSQLLIWCYQIAILEFRRKAPQTFISAKGYTERNITKRNLLMKLFAYLSPGINDKNERQQWEIYN